MHKTIVENKIYIIDSLVDANTILDEILHGLKKPQKELPSKLFYDERGSKLFEQICGLEEYYPTRIETSIMQHNIHDMVDLIGPGSMLIEYGSGNSAKTRVLLDHLPEMAAYVPVDISRDHLFKTADSLKDIYPELTIMPVWADYNNIFELPPIDKQDFHPLAYFPGSTIGNFYPKQAVDFLKNIAALVGPGGGLLIGVDLQKDTEVLNQAYNDCKGVTAAFNLNMLRHINLEFGTDFDLNQYQHLALYDQQKGRIEMYLISQIDQVVHVADKVFDFKEGERILTEISYKYSLGGFSEIASAAGFVVETVWKDPENYFSVQYLRASY